MFFKLKEILLPYVKTMPQKALSSKEQQAQKNLLSELKIKTRKTKRPLVIAIVGLLGSGMSSVSKEIAKSIGATIIEGERILVLLRKLGEDYKNRRLIAKNVMEKIIEKGGNVVIDSDHIDKSKRASLRVKTKKLGAELIFIQVYCDRDVLINRILLTKFSGGPDDFFGGAGGAKSKWLKGDAQIKAATIKLREKGRRAPLHYRWNAKGIIWILKKLPFPVFASIDTTDPGKWQTEVKKVAEKLLKF